MPIGTPISTQNTIAVVISESVVIAGFHRPMKAIAISENALNAAMPREASRHASSANSTTKMGNGTDCSVLSMKRSTVSTGHLISRKTGRRCSAVHSTPNWIQSSIGTRGRSSALNMLTSPPEAFATARRCAPAHRRRECSQRGARRRR